MHNLYRYKPKLGDLERSSDYNCSSSGPYKMYLNVPIMNF